MKRESGRSPIHHFSFGERLMKDVERTSIWWSVCYVIHSSFHQIFTLIKSNGKATEVNTAIRRLVGRTSILPTDRGKPMLQAKREQHPKTADTAAGFWKTKSHSSLGRFLHAPLRSC